MNENKEKLRNAFKTFFSVGVDKVMEYEKNDELENIIPNKTLDTHIYNFQTEEEWRNCLKTFSPKLIFCESKVDNQIWFYYRKRVSKLRYSGSVGRQIRILVQDSFTKKYIGIIGLSSDIIALKERDTYIGWSVKEKKKRLNNIMNISCCVPLSPFGFNTTGGKLLASLCFSKEVTDYYYKKYKTPLIALITTSIYGKSIQYDRLPFLKFIGYTGGSGCLHIPTRLFELGIQYCRHYKRADVDNTSLSGGKLKKLEKIIKELDLPNEMTYHYNQRGIYFGYIENLAKFFGKKTKENSRDFLLDKIESFYHDELPNVKQIFEWWKERWGMRRVSNVSISYNTNLYQFNNDLQTEFLNLIPNLVFKEDKKEKNKLYMREYRNKNRDISFKTEEGYTLKWGYSDIYKITCIPTGKSYIGKAVHVLNVKNPQKNGAYGRWKRHQNKTSRCSILSNAIQKYGVDNFNIEVICVCKTEYENQIEKKMIKDYNTIVPHGLNILPGGEGNSVNIGEDHHYFNKQFSEEYRKKLRESHSGSNHHFYGKHFSESHKQTLGNAISLAKRDYDDVVFMEILREKKSFDTIEEITERVRSKYNTKIDRNGIAKIWKGGIKPQNLDICESEEYKNLVSFVRKKIHKRILTDQEIDFVNSLKENEQKISTIKAAQIILEKFGKKISTGFIGDIWKGKLLPMYKMRENFYNDKDIFP